MNMTDQLKAWGEVHAQARSAESAARQCGEDAARTGELRREARSLRERADRLHREIYRHLDRKDSATPR